jgi:hypothetical protein
MAMRAVASIFAPDPFKCYAGCGDKLDYQALIVTKCNHIFCRACLEEWFDNKHTCPLCNKVLSPITRGNVRQRKEDPKINEANLGGEVMQHCSFKLYLERFTHYIQNDPLTLQGKLAAAKAMKISSCELLKAEKANVMPSPKASEEDQCAICFKAFPQMYFITEDEDRDSVGRFMHEGCWQATVDDKSVILEISTPDMVKVAEQLPPPRALPLEPIKPASPIKVFFVAIILPISMWALVMNPRIYHNKSFVLFVLSIPALIIFKILSLIVNGLKAVFSDKRAK